MNQSMLKLKGLGVSTGVTTGPVLVFNVLKENELPKVPKEDLNELERFEKTLQRTRENIEAAYKMLVKKGISEGEILGAYLQILDDEEFSGSIRTLISDKKMEVEDAVKETVKKISATLKEAKSEYIRSRIMDIVDLGEQLIRNMTSKKGAAISSVKPSIIIAKDLGATDVATMDKGKILGIVTEEGSPISHVSILARALKIPAVVKCQSIVDQVDSMDTIFIDGSTGEVVINP
jgi:phosphotransferase system enzyme I (PtsI)